MQSEPLQLRRRWLDVHPRLRRRWDVYALVHRAHHRQGRFDPEAGVPQSQLSATASTHSPSLQVSEAHSESSSQSCSSASLGEQTPPEQ